MLQPFDDWEVPMDKYICDVCGYIYDPEVGDPDGGIAPGHGPSRIFPTTGYAPSAASARTTSHCTRVSLRQNL